MAKKSTKKKTTKKKAAKKRATKKPEPVAVKVDLDTKIVAEVVRLIVIECQSDDEIRALSKIGESVDQYLIEAHARLSTAAHIDREAEIGASIARLKAIGSGAMRVSDFGPAIQAQKELSKLLALYPQGGGVSSAGQSTAEQLTQIEQVEAHLRPLGLVPNTHPIEAAARVAADRIRQLEAKTK